MHPYLLELAMACAIVDAGFTWHRLNIASHLELNLLVSWLARKIGPGLASVMGVLFPQLLIATILACLTSPIPLSILAGAGINRSWMQIMSIELEDKILQAGSSVPLPSPGSRKFQFGKDSYDLRSKTP